MATRTLLKMVRKAQAEGYFVTVIYFWLDSPERAMERVKARVEKGGHNIPVETIIRRYYVGLEYFFNDYMKICDRGFSLTIPNRRSRSWPRDSGRPEK